MILFPSSPFYAEIDTGREQNSVTASFPPQPGIGCWLMKQYPDFVDGYGEWSGYYGKYGVMNGPQFMDAAHHYANCETILKYGLSGIIRHARMCLEEKNFTDHQQDDFVPYPVCDSNDLEYYRINGLYYETFDENEIYEKMKAGIEQGQEMFAIRFSENAVYEVAKETIINNLILQAAQFLVDFRQLEEVKYTYAADDRKRIIMIFWYS